MTILQMVPAACLLMEALASSEKLPKSSTKIYVPLIYEIRMISASKNYSGLKVRRRCPRNPLNVRKSLPLWHPLALQTVQTLGPVGTFL